MTKRMLIDALHPEQTRVALIDGNRIDDLDFESAARKQLKGNIYLAKVTRIEPSLQAAFVEYGGNRHGFLSFAEIHPDYYKLPVADREKLDALLAEAMSPRKDDQPQPRERDLPPPQPGFEDLPAPPPSDFAVPLETDTGAGPAFSVTDWLGSSSPQDESDDEEETGISALPLLRPGAATAKIATPDEAEAELANLLPDQPLFGAVPEILATDVPALPLASEAAIEDPSGSAPTESLAGVDDVDDSDVDEGDEDRDEDEGTAADENTIRRLRQRFLRHYKIQEVMKRRQVMLVQVVKEERGNKGAALTTYLSLPGRYCVLMPNSPRGGGVSRKVTNPGERRRLKEVLDRLDIPSGMSVILRTAGIGRTDAEIRRDFEYLMRLWDTIREMTLKSTAPALIYEEGNLIKRSIRDLYDNHISEILVAGESGYQNARDFMQMLMPDHVDRIVHYQNPSVPLFFRYQAESQIETLDSPIVQLRSGGYIVINPTEALVAIDVNSGRSTRERGIEETALRTNLEAADEIARQLRLRDLAGLVVIDFIDMEDGRNNATVERRMKEAMKNDRARLQIGRISAFGLLELSRQRLRPSLLETNWEKCPHCTGLGYVKTPDTAALSVLRAIEEEGIRNRSSEIAVHLPVAISLHILNNKRAALAEIETRYGFRVLIRAEDGDSLPSGQAFRIERLRSRSAGQPVQGAVPVNSDQFMAPLEADSVFAHDMDRDSAIVEVADTRAESETRETSSPEGGEGREGREGRGRGRNRGRGRGGRGDRPGWRDQQQQRRSGPQQSGPQQNEADGQQPAATGSSSEPGSVGEQQQQTRNEGRDGNLRRRRGRRGGRNRGERSNKDASGGGSPESDQTSGNEPPAPPDQQPFRKQGRDRNWGNEPDGNKVYEPTSFEIDTTPSASRNSAPQSSTAEQRAARAAENVNQAPDKPRTGWWHRLTGA